MKKKFLLLSIPILLVVGISGCTQPDENLQIPGEMQQIYNEFPLKLEQDIKIISPDGSISKADNITVFIMKRDTLYEEYQVTDGHAEYETIFTNNGEAFNFIYYRGENNYPEIWTYQIAYDIDEDYNITEPLIYEIEPVTLRDPGFYDIDIQEWYDDNSFLIKISNTGEKVDSVLTFANTETCENCKFSLWTEYFSGCKGCLLGMSANFVLSYWDEQDYPLRFENGDSAKFELFVEPLNSLSENKTRDIMICIDDLGGNSHFLWEYYESIREELPRTLVRGADKVCKKLSEARE